MDNLQKEQNDKSNLVLSKFAHDRSQQIATAGQQLYENSKPSSGVEEPSDWARREQRRQEILEENHITSDADKKAIVAAEKDAASLDFQNNGQKASVLSNGEIAVNPEPLP